MKSQSWTLPLFTSRLEAALPPTPSLCLLGFVLCWPPGLRPLQPVCHFLNSVLFWAPGFWPEDVVKGSCSSRNVQVGPINLSRTTFRHTILKWPHRKPAEVRSAELGIVRLQDFRDHISVGIGYSLHGVQPAQLCPVPCVRLGVWV